MLGDRSRRVATSTTTQVATFFLPGWPTRRGCPLKCISQLSSHRAEVTLEAAMLRQVPNRSKPQRGTTLVPRRSYQLPVRFENCHEQNGWHCRSKGICPRLLSE